MTSFKPLRLGRSVGALILVGGLAGSAVSVAAGGGTKDSGTAYVGQVPKPGSLVYDAGVANDRVFGPVTVTFVSKPVATNGAITVKSQSVIFWTRKGTLRGTGSALLKVTNSPKPGDGTLTHGQLALTRGTGALAGHSLHATFTATGNVNYPNQYTFHYKGIYR